MKVLSQSLGWQPGGLLPATALQAPPDSAPTLDLQKVGGSGQQGCTHQAQLKGRDETDPALWVPQFAKEDSSTGGTHLVLAGELAGGMGCRS